MKKVSLVVLIVFITFLEFGYFETLKDSCVEKKENVYNQTFIYAYENLRKWEGNYSLLTYDKGGETYGGITRFFNPEWIGWEEIDRVKNDSTIEWNTRIESVEKYVKDYYYNVWFIEGFNKIREPLVAIYLFDYRNTGPISYKHLNKVLKNNGYDVSIKFELDQEIIDAINCMDPFTLVSDLKEIRKEYYERVARRNPELEIYLNGWINRASSIIS
jgi:lysozyme family protein